MKVKLEDEGISSQLFTEGTWDELQTSLRISCKGALLLVLETLKGIL